MCLFLFVLHDLPVDLLVQPLILRDDHLALVEERRAKETAKHQRQEERDHVAELQDRLAHGEHQDQRSHTLGEEHHVALHDLLRIGISHLSRVLQANGDGAEGEEPEDHRTGVGHGGIPGEIEQQHAGQAQSQTAGEQHFPFAYRVGYGRQDERSDGAREDHHQPKARRRTQIQFGGDEIDLHQHRHDHAPGDGEYGDHPTYRTDSPDGEERLEIRLIGRLDQRRRRGRVFPDQQRADNGEP